MSKLTSWFSANLPSLKTVLNALLGTQKKKVKAFVHDKADDFYNSFDHITELPTIAAFEDYLTRQAGDSKLGGAIVAELIPLIEFGIDTGIAELGLKATDALTRQELDKIVNYIDKRIDGARF